MGRTPLYNIHPQHKPFLFGRNPKLLLALQHGGEVDGLCIMIIGLEEHVRQGGAEGCMARDDVGGRGLHNHFGIKQDGVEIVHKGLALMTGPQMPALL